MHWSFFSVVPQPALRSALLRVLSILSLILLALAFLRMFSRNTFRALPRKRTVLCVWIPVKSWGYRTINRIKDVRTHRY
jgi:glucan phosphoethanolaminetransferase (alkaline phosphatase superfamily)